MSKEKGKRGEREWAEKCREFGFEARRGQQFSGASGDPDVVTNVPGTHFEVKRVEALKLWSSLLQAVEDAREFEVPVVAHKPNRKPWVVIMYGDDYLRLMRELRQRDHANAKSEEK
jgi:Holliday junction resolvase